MHSPSFLLFSIRRPFPSIMKVAHSRKNRMFSAFYYVAGRELYFPTLIDFWHHEPDGMDSGTVCKGDHGTGWSLGNIKWAYQHRDHLEVVVAPIKKFKRWKNNPCKRCGARIGYNKASYSIGYSDAGERYHRRCLDAEFSEKQLEQCREYLITLDREPMPFALRYSLEWWAEHKAGRSNLDA